MPSEKSHTATEGTTRSLGRWGNTSGTHREITAAANALMEQGYGQSNPILENIDEIVANLTHKKYKRYRYFACEKDMKRINSICPLKRVPAAELENLLLREIGSMLAKPEVIAGVMHQAAELDEHGKHLKLSTVQQAFDDLTNVWDVMFPVERYKFINEVVEKITVHIDRVEIEYKTDGLEAVITEAEASNGKNN